jgi:hypothetical protein
MPPLAAYAGSRGTGTPDPSPNAIPPYGFNCGTPMAAP